MSFREDVKLGITRISRLFLGDDNGQLGEEVTDKLTDLGTNLVSTAAEIDAAVINPPVGWPGYFIHDGMEGGAPGDGLALAIINLNVAPTLSGTPSAPDCNWIATISAADVLRAVWCDPDNQDALEYYIAPAGAGAPGPPGVPGWESDPLDTTITFDDVNSGIQNIEVWINDGVNMAFAVTYVNILDPGVDGGEVGVDASGCGGP